MERVRIIVALSSHDASGRLNEHYYVHRSHASPLQLVCVATYDCAPPTGILWTSVSVEHADFEDPRLTIKDITDGLKSGTSDRPLVLVHL